MEPSLETEFNQDIDKLNKLISQIDDEMIYVGVDIVVGFNETIHYSVEYNEPFKQYLIGERNRLLRDLRLYKISELTSN